MKHIAKRLKEDSNYQGFFLKALHKYNKKFNTNGIGGMSDAEKKEFFDYVDKNYKAKTESVTGGDPVQGTILVEFEAMVPGQDEEFIKNNVAARLENLLRRERKYKYTVAKNFGDPQVEIL